MRITGGEARGRRLKTLRGAPIRPTADRVREALFDILGARVKGARFLDLYAGTGAVACDALSRGAANAVLVEADRRALRLIRENLRIGSWEARAEVVGGDARRALPALAARPHRFDVIFLDPPYDEPSLPGTLALAAALLVPGGILIVEHRASKRVEPPVGAPLSPCRSYRYGDTALTVCRALPGDRRP